MRVRTIDVRPGGGVFRVLTETQALPGLAGIGYRYLLPRHPKPKQAPEDLKRDLAIAYAEHRRHDHLDGSGIVSLRRTRLHLVKGRRLA